MVSFLLIAQELLSKWMESKLQLDLKNDGEKEFDTLLLEEPPAAPPKYEQFDGERTTKQFPAFFVRKRARPHGLAK